MKKIFLILLMSVPLLIFIPKKCSTDQIEETVEKVTVNPEFATYIRAYTSGIISKRSSITIELIEDFENYESIPLSNDLFHLTPSTPGKAMWVDENTIEFVPQGDLRSGQDYKLDFELGKLLDVEDEYQTFSYNFSTKLQYLTVHTNSLKATKKTQLEKQNLSGVVYTNDVVDEDNLERTITATQKGKELDIEWKHLSDTKHEYIVKNIERSDDPSSVDLSWNGAPIETGETGNKTVEVPALGDFKILDIEVIQEPEQFVKIEFSDPLQDLQNLNGIIKIEDMNNLNYNIEDQEIHVYLPHRLSGTRAITINPGIKNINGYKMINSDEVDLVFEGIKPDLRLVESGVIVPSSKEGIMFPFETVNLRAVDVFITKIYESNILQFLQINHITENNEMKRVSKEVLRQTIRIDKPGTNLHEWNRYTLDLSKLIAIDPGAIYQVEIRCKKEFSTYGCGEEQAELTTFSKTEEKSWSESEWVSWDYWYDNDYWYGDDYNYRESDNPCNSAYYYDRAIKSNVLASNIGMIAKAGSDKKLHVFVNDLRTTNPVSGATVEFYSYQQQLLGKTYTNSKGMAALKLEEKPFVVIAKNGNERSYIKLRDGESLSLSKFDVSGATIQEEIKGYMYSERGVWRPGDSIYVAFMMEDKNKVLPKGHPVSFTLQDPKNNIVYKTSTSKNVNGLYDFRTGTDMEAPTGNYLATVKVGNREFNKTLKVETVKPNRLKVYLDFNNELLSNGNRDALGMLSVKWLHGAIAKNLKSRVNMSLTAGYTHFEKFNDYIFDDPLKSFNAEDHTVFDHEVDEEGKAEFKLDMRVKNSAPGMLRAHFITKVFEKGGGFSIDRHTMPYSPYKNYVGLKVPEGSMEYGTLETDKDIMIDIAHVSETGAPVNSSEVEVKVYKLEWRWWWDSYDNDLASYISKYTTTPIENKMVSINKGKGQFKLRVNRPEWGRFFVQVIDKKSGHSTGKVVYIDWPYWARSERTTIENATMLSFNTDKEVYQVGEKVKVSFPSSSNGRAIITLESGTKVVKKYETATQKGETRFEFTTDASMAPNVYVHVTLLQPHNITENDLPIRMYGVAPIIVENPGSHLKPVISCSDEFKPESTASIKVREENGKSMTYTLAVVDDGLLDLTSFKTPQPWDHFYAREALGVRSWDMYDDVMGAFAFEMNRVLAVGGDGSGRLKKPNKANRFKPMVRYIGPFHLPAGSSKTHKIDIPNYVGSVRVMVVAGEKGNYGNAEKTVPVKSPLMVLGTLPRVLSPTEAVYLPVNVFAMEDEVKNVDVTIKVNDKLQIMGQATKQVRFNKTGDEVVNFALEVAKEIGIAKVEITARSGKHVAHHAIELDVRSPNPVVADVHETVIEAGKNWDVNIAHNGIKGTNKAYIELSAIPSINLQQRLRYLIQYPHGCVEQTTSSVFPQLALHKITKLDADFKSRIDENIAAAITRLKLFQTSDGGFGYWPGDVHSNPWGTTYAGHFLIEASLHGHKVPKNMKKAWIKYQKDQARDYVPKRSNRGSYQNNNLDQAYRLYTLALAQSPELGAMNRLRETPDLDDRSKWRLAAAYSLIGQPEAAELLIRNASSTVSPYVELSNTFGSNIRDEAMILETMVLMDKKTDAAVLTKKIAKQLNQDQWMSTQATAYCLLAVSKFAGSEGTDKTMRFNYSLNGKLLETKATQEIIFSQELLKKGKLSIENSGKGVLYAKVVVESVPVIGDQTASSNHVELSIKYTSMKGEEIDPRRIEQGTDFMAEVTIKNNGTRGNIPEMTLNQLFPSGWEIHNSRMDGHLSSENTSTFDYQDIRDDRVYTYFDLASSHSHTYKVRLNATYLGRFYLPTIETEAMYDNTINARIPGFWTEVVKSNKLLSSQP